MSPSNQVSFPYPRAGFATLNLSPYLDHWVQVAVTRNDAAFTAIAPSLCSVIIPAMKNDDADFIVEVHENEKEGSILLAEGYAPGKGALEFLGKSSGSFNVHAPNARRR